MRPYEKDIKEQEEKDRKSAKFESFGNEVENSPDNLSYHRRII